LDGFGIRGDDYWDTTAHMAGGNDVHFKMYKIDVPGGDARSPLDWIGLFKMAISRTLLPSGGGIEINIPRGLGRVDAALMQGRIVRTFLSRRGGYRRMEITWAVTLRWRK